MPLLKLRAPSAFIAVMASISGSVRGVSWSMAPSMMQKWLNWRSDRVKAKNASTNMASITTRCSCTSSAV
ncbi:hypothetical protein D9M68_982930 [compost metagenome]